MQGEKNSPRLRNSSGGEKKDMNYKNGAAQKATIGIRGQKGGEKKSSSYIGLMTRRREGRKARMLSKTPRKESAAGPAEKVPFPEPAGRGKGGEVKRPSAKRKKKTYSTEPACLKRKKRLNVRVSQKPFPNLGKIQGKEYVLKKAAQLSGSRKKEKGGQGVALRKQGGGESIRQSPKETCILFGQKGGRERGTMTAGGYPRRKGKCSQREKKRKMGGGSKTYVKKQGVAHGSQAGFAR